MIKMYLSTYPNLVKKILGGVSIVQALSYTTKERERERERERDSPWTNYEI
jgi:hypothetical protein